MFNIRRSMLYSLVFLGMLSVGHASTCFTAESKKNFDKSRNVLTGLENNLSNTVTTLQSQTTKIVKALQSKISETVTTLQGQINSINGKVKALDKDLVEVDGDCKRRRWIKHNGHCYHFGTKVSSWLTAQTQCIKIGGYLAKIEGATENQWVLENMRKAKKGFKSFYWLGLIDLEDSKWIWAYDETTPKYTRWHPGLPSKMGTTNCMAGANHGGTWVNFRCKAPLAYVCEINVCPQ